MRVIVLCILVACGSGRLAPPSRAPGLPAQEYRLLDGGTWSSAREGAGRVIVLDVWATYCTPCKKAFPKLDALAAQFPDVAVIGLSIDKDDDRVRAFLAELPVKFTIARVDEAVAQKPPLALRELPTLFLIDKRGRVRLRAVDLPEADYAALPDLVAELRAE
jgi:thiol-disulfide isomerase/thioredoxin